MHVPLPHLLSHCLPFSFPIIRALIIQSHVGGEAEGACAAQDGSGGEEGAPGGAAATSLTSLPRANARPHARSLSLHALSGMLCAACLREFQTATSYCRMHRVAAGWLSPTPKVGK